MSSWTYVSGVIEIRPFGGTQAEKRYVLDTVLAHLPMVRGSEQNMKVHVVQASGHNISSSHDEFGTPLFFMRGGDFDGWMKVQGRYFLVLDGQLRDKKFAETKLELNKWLNRLAKRIPVEEVLVRLRGYKKDLVISNSAPYEQMLEPFSWESSSNGEPAWAEYLLLRTYEEEDCK